MNYAEERAKAFEALLARLESASGIARPTAATLDDLARRHERLALLYTGEPARSPESWDVCVVLPDLLANFAGVAGAILGPAESALASARFGVDKLPALVLLRRGEYVGVVEGMRDWRPFVDEFGALLQSPTQLPPVAGQYPAQPIAPRSA